MRRTDATGFRRTERIDIFADNNSQMIKEFRLTEEIISRRSSDRTIHFLKSVYRRRLDSHDSQAQSVVYNFLE